MEVITYIGAHIPLLPALLAVVVWKHLDIAARWFAVLLWVVSTCSTVGDIWTHVIASNNLPFFHVYIVLEYILLIIIFSYILEVKRKLRFVLSFTIPFATLWLLNVFAGDGIWNHPTYIHVLEAAIIVRFALTWFLKVLREKKILSPAKTFAFWMCTGLLMFFSANILLFIFTTFIIAQSDAVFMAIWGVHAILVILLYLTYTIAILWARKNPTSS